MSNNKHVLEPCMICDYICMSLSPSKTEDRRPKAKTEGNVKEKKQGN